MTIENALARYEREERTQARERLDELWDDAGRRALEEPARRAGRRLPSLVPGPREGQREAVQARALLEKAERLLERVQAEDRADVERLMERVRTALADRQWDKVTEATNELDGRLVLPRRRLIPAAACGFRAKPQAAANVLEMLCVVRFVTMSRKGRNAAAAERT